MTENSSSFYFVLNIFQSMWSIRTRTYQEIKTRSNDRFTLSNVSEEVLEAIKVLQKLPKARIFQKNQLEAFKKPDSITVKFGWYQWKANGVFGWTFFFWKRTLREVIMLHSRSDAQRSRWQKPSCGNLLRRNNYGAVAHLIIDEKAICIMELFVNDRCFDKKNMPYILHSYS